jgi:hypothetical protein
MTEQHVTYTLEVVHLKDRSNVTWVPRSGHVPACSRRIDELPCSIIMEYYTCQDEKMSQLPAN